jgi:hypothetical protein
MSARADLHTATFENQIASLLEGMPSDERAFYAAAMTVDARLSDPTLREKLASVANRTLTVVPGESCGQSGCGK